MNGTTSNDVAPPRAPRVVDAERARVLALLRRFGRNSTSFQVLEPGYAYFFADDDACVAYVDTGLSWVAAGDPIAPIERVAEVAARFVAAARARRRLASFVATSPEVTLGDVTRFRLGAQPEWNPRVWPTTVKSSRNVKEQLRRARAKGVVVRRLATETLLDRDAPERHSIKSLTRRWLASRSMAPLGFLVHLDPFGHPAERRCFVAEHHGRIVAFASMIPVYASDGYFLEDLIRDPSAPNGTVELLFDACMRAAAEEGATYFTLGLAPLAGEVVWPLRITRKLTRGLYDFEGLERFKTKLRPARWRPIELATPRGSSTLVAIVEMLRAFARGSFLAFGLSTLVRGPSLVVAALALLLVPWILMLAFLPSHALFPTSVGKWAWITVHLAMVPAMLRLGRRHQPRLGVALACLATFDAVLTALRIGTHALGRAHAPFEAARVALALAAPILASVVLWGAVVRHRQLRDEGAPRIP